jgi:hypothetical protein
MTMFVRVDFEGFEVEDFDEVDLILEIEVDSRSIWTDLVICEISLINS